MASNFICNVLFISHTQIQRNCKKYINHIEISSIHANVCAQKTFGGVCILIDKLPSGIASHIMLNFENLAVCVAFESCSFH